MKSTPTPGSGGTCPDRDILCAFGVGNLPGDVQEAVAEHLRTCPSCVQLLQNVDDGSDSLLAELRRPLPPEALSAVAFPDAPEPTTSDDLGTVPASEGASADPAPSSGTRYDPLRVYAEGGLGTVLVARDRELDREVALKQMREDVAGSASMRRRFLREAEITGKLEHPGVVPVYGLVQGAGGEPCYAMRLVRGETLREAARRFHEAGRPDRDPGERFLALRQLLGRFVTVCNTVAYAHSRGVLHRDLKPDNVLLGPYGETLVVDWGLAKVVSREGQAEGSTEEATLRPSPGGGAAETAAGVAVGTPAYMSPEQAAGKVGELGPATDIYSLGATLYALLTNRPPVVGRDTGEVLQKVRQGDWPPPRAVNPAIPLVLDAICRKAMARCPAERYATPLALAEDIEHFLADEPVGAVREPLGVRARRWGRKHPGPVAGLAAALLVGLLGLGISTVIQARQNHELELARRAAADRTDVLASVLHNLDPRSEEKEGKALRVLLGDHLGDAVKQLEGEAAGDPLAVARLQNELGVSLRELGHLEEAKAALTNARQTRLQRLGADDPDTLSSTHELARLYLDLGRFDEAEPLLQQALEGRRRRLGADDADTLKSLNNLAGLYQARGRYGEAETLFKQVLEASRSKLGADHLLTFAGMDNLALLYLDRGRYDEAEALFNQVVEGRRRKLGADHPLTLRSLNNLGGLCSKRGRHGEAETLFRQALEGSRRKLGADHPLTLACLSNLAGLYQDRGRYAEAEPLYQEALGGYRQQFGPDHLLTIACTSKLAVLYRSQKRPDRAIPLFEEAFALLTRKRGADDPATLRTLANLGATYRDAGRPDDGIRCLEQALAAARRRPGPLPAPLASIPGDLADAYDRTNQLGKAEALYREVLEQARRQYGADDPRTAAALAQLGSNLLRQHQHAEAEKALRECLAIREKKEPDAWTTFNTQSMLGEALLGQKHHADAEAPLRAGYEGLKQRAARIPPPLRQGRLTEALQRLVQLYDAWGKPDEAARWRKELDAATTNEQPPKP
jgi:tetratricopeptide (TPR) repeat protein/tRNA A-37 threonylcarbamoyl transferase component Bud32